ncbi:MAG: hypothetical protein O3A63_19955 [Proteobacteria bacterium]|nr:hypothetical protein [Pseudomonadota bacterium]
MKTLTTITFLLIFTCSASVCASEEARAQIEGEVMQVLDAFITSFSAKDPAAHAATYHFPHYRLARGVMNSWETYAHAVQAHVGVFEALPETGWDRSIWIHRRIVTLTENKVHVDTRFARLRKNGSEIGRYDSLYILIRQDGRWGIKMRSSFL